eukprot:6490365-Alexandrium_andersonii.AAC.1
MLLPGRSVENSARGARTSRARLALFKSRGRSGPPDMAASRSSLRGGVAAVDQSPAPLPCKRES